MSEDLQGLLALIYQGEATGNMDAVSTYVPRHLRPPRPVTQMTVGEVHAWQNRVKRSVKSTAVGGVQIISSTMGEIIASGVVSPNDTFDRATQDRIAVALMKGRGLSRWQSGEISTAEFGSNLAKEWAALPVLRGSNRGRSHYAGDGLNAATISTKAFETALGDPGRVLADISGFPTVLPAGGGTADHGARWREQNESDPDAYRHAQNWSRGGFESRGFNEPDPMDVTVRPIPEPIDYRTPTGPGGGPVMPSSFGQSFWDEFSDDAVYRSGQEYFQGPGATAPIDMKFDPAMQAFADGLGQHWEYLGEARNPDHYAWLKGQIDRENARDRRQEVTNRFGASMLGAIAAPTSLVSMAIPGGFAISGARIGLRSAAAVGGMTYGLESGMERLRAAQDPFSTTLDSQMRVWGSTLIAGALGGVIGRMARGGVRPDLGDDLMADIAAARGVGLRTSDIDVGGVRLRVEPDEAAVRAAGGPGAARGAVWTGDRVVVDDGAIQARWAAGDRAGGARTVEELAEFEVARAASIGARLRDKAQAFFRDESGAAGRSEPFSRLNPETGKVEVSRARISEAIAKGEPVPVGPAKGSANAERIRPVMVDAGKLGLKDTAQLVGKAEELAGKARDQREFRDMLSAEIGRMKGGGGGERAFAPEELRKIEREAASALEDWRKRNNAKLRERRAKIASRMIDSPTKRIDRNALSGEVRDLADILAHDGGFLRRSDGSGVNVGPSVYSRVKTWDGVVRKALDTERELFAKMKGIEGGDILDGIGRQDLPGEGMTKAEFRDRAAKALITGEADEIAEVNDMAKALKAAYGEFKTVSDELKVISPELSMTTKVQNLTERMDYLRAQQKAGENSANADVAARAGDAGVEADQIARQIDNLRERMAEMRNRPNEDYFSRVYNKAAIRENREAFTRLVKNWMREDPWVEKWVPGKDEIMEEIWNLRGMGIADDDPRILKLKDAAAAAPERSRWTMNKASVNDEALEKRARDFVEQVLDEAEPDDLAMLREPHRPTFGRHRQLNVPNAALLKDGGKGNRIADFIVTDWPPVLKIYTDRMAPAIEMARSFGNVADGTSWSEGFEKAMSRARMAEKEAWGSKPGFEDHWAPLERDFLHLRDRVTNRVSRMPERWDNRAATVLKNWSHLAFMGASALPALQEVGTLVMRHGMEEVYRTAFAKLDDELAKALAGNVEEMRAAGAIMDVQMGTALSGFAETGMEAVGETQLERLLRVGSNRYFVWNGMAPLTARLKEIDAGVRVHDTLARIDRIALGTGSTDDMAQLDRWGISRADAKAMRKEPMFQTPEGHWQANTAAWGDEDLVRRFRAAIRQGNENTILMATAADKPILVDGAFYLRRNKAIDKYAHRAGLELQGDYWRMQSGLMTLPFTFWNYAIAASNKIVVSGLDEPSTRMMQGIAGLVAMGWMVSQVRSDDWDRVSFGEKMKRSIDQSGVMGVLPNYIHLGQGTAIGATGRNPLPFDPRHGYEPSALDAAFNLMGAGPSVARNAVQGAAEGDAGRLSWALPFRNHLMLEGMFDRAVDGLEGRA